MCLKSLCQITQDYTRLARGKPSWRIGPIHKLKELGSVTNTTNCCAGRICIHLNVAWWKVIFFAWVNCSLYKRNNRVFGKWYFVSVNGSEWWLTVIGNWNLFLCQLLFVKERINRVIGEMINRVIGNWYLCLCQLLFVKVINRVIGIVNWSRWK